jgi:site-specific DNA-cytosine methylase
VRGLLSFNDFFFMLLETLEGNGYAVRFNLLDACSYGVPQHRERVFIEGARKDLKILPQYPAPTHFSQEMIKSKVFPPLPLMAEKCFAVNGFAKEEIKDCWFNRTLHIFMNRKTAAARVEQATREILLEALLKHPKLKSSKKPVRLVRMIA